MAPPPSPPADFSRADFYRHFFALVAAQGWLPLTLPRVARKGRLPLVAILQAYPDKDAALAGFGAFLDAQLAATPPAPGAPLKERLFDLLMQRFDLLQPYRAGLVRLADDAQAGAGAFLLATLLPAFFASARRMAELAEVPQPGHWRGPLHTLLLQAAYADTLRTWKHDGSADLSATMAALDRWLDRLLRWWKLGGAADSGGGPHA